MLEFYAIGAVVYITVNLGLMAYSKFKKRIEGNNDVNDIDDYDEEVDGDGANPFLFLILFVLGSTLLWPLFSILQMAELVVKSEQIDFTETKNNDY
jgi:hypothetical protein